ncbi:hypothetical protein EV137_0848 [Kribbella pratensis]|uniref:ATP/GTP-binding protein n=1 Tax=Kribbella pratensis TaxID=2512112 RepID=A0ABY2FKB3_9ACTN|nr:hypothetical protein [Kribbella pratensis]TDW93557.1 hypothetical protein EV137_0848 [Kribbella pratensis]
MHNRVGRTLLVLSAVLALVTVAPATTAAADTIQTGNSVCSMYVNSVGFGAYCSSGNAYIPTIQPAPPPPTWRDKLNGRPFVPCRDFGIPKGIRLPKAPDGKEWVMRITITDYKLDTYNGGPDAHLERAYVPVDAQDRAQCPFPDYMEQFWRRFEGVYPPPALQVMPTYTPRVNVPAYFTLTPESSEVQTDNTGSLSGLYDDRHNLSMRGMVVEMVVDPGDNTGTFKCRVGVTPLDDPDGYDQTQDPYHQMNPCKHVYKKSSASQPDKMYTVKLTITWEVSYWIGKDAGGWKPIGQANVTAVQRLPVQEAQAIGG